MENYGHKSNSGFTSGRSQHCCWANSHLNKRHFYSLSAGKPQKLLPHQHRLPCGNFPGCLFRNFPGSQSPLFPMNKQLFLLSSAWGRPMGALSASVGRFFSSREPHVIQPDLRSSHTTGKMKPQVPEFASLCRDSSSTRPSSPALPLIPHWQPVSVPAWGNLEEVIDITDRVAGCPQIHMELVADGAAAHEVVQLVKT